MKNGLWAFLISSLLVLSGCSYAMEELGVFKTTDGLPKVGSLQFAEQKISFDVYLIFVKIQIL